jgi:hypothetical protein
MLAPQPAPVEGKGSVVDDLVDAIRQARPLCGVVDLLPIRQQQGRERYGTELQYDNGRDPRCDLLQELVDALVYASQANNGSAEHSVRLRLLLDLTWDLQRELAAEPSPADVPRRHPRPVL